MIHELVASRVSRTPFRPVEKIADSDVNRFLISERCNLVHDAVTRVDLEPAYVLLSIEDAVDSDSVEAGEAHVARGCECEERLWHIGFWGAVFFVCSLHLLLWRLSAWILAHRFFLS